MTMETAKNEAIETMQRLGLTVTQARIYLALLDSGESTVKTISKESGVARAEIYRIMPTLQKTGLVKKILGIPLTFKSTPLQEGLVVLMKQKNIEHLELQKKAKKLASTFKENNYRKKQKKENEFAVTPGKDAHIKWLKNRFEKNQASSEAIITWKDHKTVHFFCEKELKRAASRGVLDRVIIYISDKEKTAYENDETFKNLPPNVQKRIVFSPPLVLGGVSDSEEVIIATTLNNPIQTGENALWTNNPSIIALFQNYFETLWKKAVEYRI